MAEGSTGSGDGHTRGSSSSTGGAGRASRCRRPMAASCCGGSAIMYAGRCGEVAPRSGGPAVPAPERISIERADRSVLTDPTAALTNEASTLSAAASAPNSRGSWRVARPPVAPPDVVGSVKAKEEVNEEGTTTKSRCSCEGAGMRSAARGSEARGHRSLRESSASRTRTAVGGSVPVSERAFDSTSATASSSGRQAAVRISLTMLASKMWSGVHSRKCSAGRLSSGLAASRERAKPAAYVAPRSTNRSITRRAIGSAWMAFRISSPWAPMTMTNCDMPPA
eukprot:7391732-Prymnesium_polylepis.7